MPKKIYKYKRPPTKTEYIVFKSISNILIMFGVLFILFAFGPVISDELWWLLKEVKSQEFILITNENIESTGNPMGPYKEPVKDSIFSRLLSTRPIELEPVNKNFSLVIEKIGVNVPVIRDVSITNQDQYNAALKQGVAHASVSSYPSNEPGNTYLFAHASVNFWQLGKYATVFNLLRKLEIGDRINVFWEGREYVYEVVNKEVLDGWNTYPITRSVIEPTLTLQTCDPPGTTLNRLVVTSNLIEVK